METRRLNKPLIIAAIAAALVLGTLIGIASGVVDRIFGGPDPQTIESRGGDEGGYVLIGNTAADTILGDKGYDTADGYGGDDTCSAEVVTRCEPTP